MNRFNFNNTGGFPFELDSLDELYKAFNILNCIGEVSGDKTIVKGCVTNGTTVSDGIVYVNGEMLEFRGGNKLSTVKIFEQPISKVFENGEQKEVFFHRWVGFGSGEGSMPWADFKLIISLRELQGRLLPPGTNPQMYTGPINAIPEGWQLCDGTNGTPPLQGMFIVGYDPNDPDYDAIGEKGGKKAVSLTEKEGPAHSHSGKVNLTHRHEYKDRYFAESRPEGIDGSEHLYSPVAGSGDTDRDNDELYYKKAQTDYYSEYKNFTTESSGSGEAHENRPPYYTLAYIIYTGN